MPTAGESEAKIHLAGQTMAIYFELLTDVNNLGIQGFAALLDGSTEEELRALLGASEVIRKALSRFRGM